MPGERAIDSMDDPTKPRNDLNALPRLLLSSPKERNQAFFFYLGGADLNALSIKPRTTLPRLSSSMLGERTIDFMDDKIKPRADLDALPRLYHPAQESSTRSLLSIPGKQISMLYPSNQELLYPGFYHLR